MNTKAKDMGYLQNRIASTFLPYVRKGTISKLGEDVGSSGSE